MLLQFRGLVYYMYVHYQALIQFIYTQVMVLAVFFAYIGGAIYGLTTLQEGLQRRKLSRADSYSIEFYDREDFYFREFPYRMQVKLCEEHSYILCMLLHTCCSNCYLAFNTKYSAFATRLENVLLLLCSLHYTQCFYI